uniref:Uncharacterized protein n=1 Tax=Candidatus Kentrum sp. DK TaxID=2126562 RepID=A0A450TFP1_9GAMM|nr:MAG: hypothetical protein BECKDK2373C_GA0170839_108115 [Candidatus Kentron sp. DK]VFJ66013.1 MAG: hypothetical protein BECKDK2373B_GA0170837_11582 [Candidatus Kentron sp. DK]
MLFVIVSRNTVVRRFPNLFFPRARNINKENYLLKRHRT